MLIVIESGSMPGKVGIQIGCYGQKDLRINLQVVASISKI